MIPSYNNGGTTYHHDKWIEINGGGGGGGGAVNHHSLNYTENDHKFVGSEATDKYRQAGREK